MYAAAALAAAKAGMAGAITAVIRTVTAESLTPGTDIRAAVVILVAVIRILAAAVQADIPVAVTRGGGHPKPPPPPPKKHH